MREINKRIRLDADLYFLLDRCLVLRGQTFHSYIRMCVNELVREYADDGGRAALIRPIEDAFEAAANSVAEQSEVRHIRSVLKSTEPGV